MCISVRRHSLWCFTVVFCDVCSGSVLSMWQRAIRKSILLSCSWTFTPWRHAVVPEHNVLLLAAGMLVHPVMAQRPHWPQFFDTECGRHMLSSSYSPFQAKYWIDPYCPPNKKNCENCVWSWRTFSKSVTGGQSIFFPNYMGIYHKYLRPNQ